MKIFAATFMLAFALSAIQVGAQETKSKEFPPNPFPPGSAEAAKFRSEMKAPSMEVQNAKPQKLLTERDPGFAKHVPGPPRDFPLPVYPKSDFVVAHESKAPPNDKRTFRLRYCMQMPVDQALEWYKQALAGEGWQIKKERQQKMRVFETTALDLHKDQMTAHINFLPENTKKYKRTRIIMTLVGY